MDNESKRSLVEFLVDRPEKFGIYFPSIIVTSPVLYRPGTSEVMAVPDLYIHGRYGKCIVGLFSDSEVPSSLEAIALWECFLGVKENFGTSPELWNLSYDSQEQHAKGFLLYNGAAARLYLDSRGGRND